MGRTGSDWAAYLRYLKLNFHCGKAYLHQAFAGENNVIHVEYHAWSIPTIPSKCIFIIGLTVVHPMDENQPWFFFYHIV